MKKTFFSKVLAGLCAVGLLALMSCSGGTDSEIESDGTGATICTVTFYPLSPTEAGEEWESIEKMKRPMTYYRGAECVFPEDLFSSSDGYIIAGWSDENNTVYQIGERFIVDSDKNFYALWEKDVLSEITIDGIVYAYKIDDEGNGYYEVSNTFTSITQADIKNEIDGIPVTSMNETAFYMRDSLINVIIPDSLTNFENSIGVVFYGCDNLENITVDDNNPNYSSQDGILYNKDKTNIIHIPSAIKGVVTISNGVTSLEDYVFHQRRNLESVTIPSTVTSIGNHAFHGCTSLTSVTIPDSVTSIGEDAFYECSDMTSITMPDGVVSIGERAFYGCSSLTSVTIPNNVTSMERATFYGCSSIENIMIPDSITTIGSSVFYNCSNLISITIPDSVTSIGDYAFYGCTSLTSVTIPNSVTNIMDYAFQGCASLTSMDIPVSVTSIGNSVFIDCSNLESITVDDNNPSYSSQDGILYNKYKTNLICVPQAINGNVTIPDSVTYIAENAFYACRYLTSVTLSSNVTSIGKGAFSGCSSLQEMTLPFVGSSVSRYATTTYLGYIFGGTDNTAVPYSLRTVIILDGMTTISKNAFSGCRYLRSVTIPDSVTSIENGALSDCNNLQELTLPFSGASKNGTSNTHFDYIFGGTTTYSGSSAYNKLVPSSLRKVTITGGIGDYAFYRCKDLTSVTIGIGTGVSNIGEYAFYGCSGLTSLMIGTGVSIIGRYAFRDCSGLTSLVIPDSVTLIGARAFNMCTGLASVTMSSSLQVIGDLAFAGCMALMDIYFKGTPAQWSAIEKGSMWDYSTGGHSGSWPVEWYTMHYEY